MMKQQPDNFFREKLEGFQRPAPAGAWDRIESRLEKKNKVSGIWWKIAASLLLLATLTYWLLPETGTSTEQTLAQSETAPSVPEVKTNKPTGQEVPVQNSKEPDIVSDKKVSQREKNLNQKNKTTKIKIKPTLEHKQKTPDSFEDTADLNNVILQQESVTPTVADTSDPMLQEKNITLKFSAEETNRYLNKNTLAQATSEGKKSSTLKKLLKKANDLKSNQDPFGDLREKKNEILALNFKNEKRGQNK
jgi:hypothetical protein